MQTKLIRVAFTLSPSSVLANRRRIRNKLHSKENVPGKLEIGAIGPRSSRFEFNKED